MDAPKSLASPAVRQARFGMLQQLHVLALTRYVESLRLEMGSEYGIPYFDPLDGGTDAECLFLLEAPGPKAIATGFVSRNNPDETAKNFFQLNRDAGLERKRTVVWNIVPWYIGSGTKIRPATTRDLGQAAPALANLLTLLPAVHTIVLVGKKAMLARAAVTNLAPSAGIHSMLHPSPMFVNRARGNRKLLLNQLAVVVAGIHAKS
ncbi:uracil-DNA glycosylase [Xanthomonas sp. WHRI 8391]|uniref:Uracil-DNA glycosylase-like domain-containing protein n=1 Tax=Xanthomonas hortorum pv. carotae TaxID=487904 RepID=A0A6V7FML5_9XANT|nr:uracil-DNA glycosylase [Xanthomonas hortorum]MBG3849329.1 uracil-DNA glycosylase [Xanthomonas hortorum pv. carotae]UTS74519.1 uracil-DNA glycosylase [Xanthomonas hortorum]CAD0364538.1 hypothetical protein CFBP7900_42870 [Xanthomonas hortorum pv. carotae]CAD0364539.1 hypothetical protein CFBP7900_42870 [Xanthomonas hortorum pv. carotae]